MSQQTAVSWLAKELEGYGDPQVCEITWKDLESLVEQAKQIEKEQVVEAWNDGNFLGRNGNILADYSDGNRYYKKEFENK